jgi:shikimate kinase
MTAGQAIQIIGPGGAGKSTVGALLAQRLGWHFTDLDAYFTRRSGDISRYLAEHSYEGYAAQNVRHYMAARAEASQPTVFALSSGFMVYPTSITPEYPALVRAIESHPATVLLIPSLDLEECVALTVQRQLARPYLRPDAVSEERKIRERFALYCGLECAMFETSASPHEVVTRLVRHFRADRSPSTPATAPEAAANRSAGACPLRLECPAPRLHVN